MSARFAKSALVAAALTGAMAAVPAAVSAQSYGNGYYNNGYGQSYDRCQTYSDGRTGAGALIGGGIGAVAGSQIAARGRRTEGSVIGGVLGAVIGAQVGRASNNNCRSEYRDGYAYNRGTTYSPAQNYYYSNDRYNDRAYYGNRYDDRRYDNRYDGGRRYENGYEISADGYYYFDPRRGWLPR